jgi:hypothetical protein
MYIKPSGGHTMPMCSVFHYRQRPYYFLIIIDRTLCTINHDAQPLGHKISDIEASE